MAPAPQPVAAAPSLDAIALQRLREENERLRGELDASRELEALRLTELAAMTAAPAAAAPAAAACFWLIACRKS